MMYYIAHRLFSLHDRALGAFLAGLLASEVGLDQVFLPFCDTDEEALVSSHKGRVLYDLDRERLDHLDGMIAVLHGPSLDDGVCMEIGYTVAAGAPVVILTTDFQTYGLSVDGPHLEFPDPLLQVVAPDVVRVAMLAPPAEPSTSSTLYRQYYERNMAPLREAARRAIDALLVRRRTPVPPPVVEPTNLAYLEPSPYAAELDTTQEASALRRRGLKITSAGRFAVGDAMSPVEQARVDWQSALSSDLLVVDVRGPECPAGAAALIGMATRRRCPVIGRVTAGSYTFAPGREPNRRNLMIHYSLIGTYSRGSEFESVLGEAL
jgi:hypothetical protein